MSTGARMPTPVLAGLTAAVLASHLWLLHRAAPRQPAAAAPRPASFVTRGIRPAPPSAAPDPAAAPAAARPATSPAARPRVGRHEVAPLPGGRLAATPAGASPDAGSSSPQAASAATAAPELPGGIRIPASAELRYQVTSRVKQEIGVGSSELSWQRDDSRYEARFAVAGPRGRARVQHSIGRLGVAGLEPLRFGDRGRGEQATHFDRDGQRVLFSSNRPAAPLAPGAQDRLSVLLQLAGLVAGDPRAFPAGATVAIQTATTREADVWVFTVEGEEELQLPGGALPAIRLVRAPRGEFDQRLELWLAPGQAYVPVRLRLTQPNGDWADHQWSATDRR